MADDTALAQAADTAERDRLLALLREHLTISVKLTDMFGGGRSLSIDVDFDGEPITQDWVVL